MSCPHLGEVPCTLGCVVLCCAGLLRKERTCALACSGRGCGGVCLSVRSAGRGEGVPSPRAQPQRGGKGKERIFPPTQPRTSRPPRKSSQRAVRLQVRQGRDLIAVKLIPDFLIRGVRAEFSRSVSTIVLQEKLDRGGVRRSLSVSLITRDTTHMHGHRVIGCVSELSRLARKLYSLQSRSTMIKENRKMRLT